MTTPAGFVNPIGPGLQPGRIDMGVDYTGSGPLYAMGSGTITNINNSGWPGGRFIGLHLDSGQYVYYAENIVPKVNVGQRVSAGQLIGTAVGTYPYIEIGWAAAPGTGETMAAATGQSKLGQSQGDPGKYSTGYGVSMSNLIHSLGGPAGVVSPGGVQGAVSSPGASGSGTAGESLAGCLQAIFPNGLIWLVIYALRYTKERKRKLSRGKCGHRQGSHEKRDKRRRGGTSKASAWSGRGND